MDKVDLVQLIVLILSVFAVIIPLGVKLYKQTKELVETKNWPRLVAAVSVYMQEAEQLLDRGEDRKAWVMAMIQTTADQLNYTLSSADIKNLEDLIDQLCEMSKVVNVEIVEEESEDGSEEIPVESEIEVEDEDISTEEEEEEPVEDIPGEEEEISEPEPEEAENE